MNVLFICSAKTWGGNEKWVSIAMSGLQSRHRVFFLGKGDYLKDRFHKDIPFFSAPFTSVWDMQTRNVIHHIVTKYEMDVVISTKKKEYFLAGLVTRSLGVKHVLRLGIVRKMKWPLWHRLIYKELNDGIIVNAYRIREQLMHYRWMRNHPVQVIYNGIPDLDNVCSRSVPSDKFIVVSTGMLTKRKGFHFLIEAVSRLPDQQKDRLSVHILGKGREQTALAKQIRIKGLENVVFLEGFDKPGPWLNKASLFCLFSANEGISNALVEAMAAGVPVLTTDAGGAGEFISEGENGYLVPREVMAIEDSLSKLMDLPPEELQRTGRNGQETVASLFSMERMVIELESCLHNFA